jgi:hypothetical protein
VALLAAAVLATVFTLPASAQQYQVVVQLEDGSTTTVVLELPPGTTLDQVAGYGGLPGTPVALHELATEPPVGEIASDEPPGPAPEDPETDPAPDEPPPADPPPTDPPPTDEPPGDEPPADDPPDDQPPAPEDAPAPGASEPPPSSPQAPPGTVTPEPAPAPSGETQSGSAPPDEPRPDGDDVGADSTPLGGGVTAGRRPLRNPDGTPTRANPGFVDVLPGPSTAIGVPNFIIRKFRVPPFLLPIYQAAGTEYGVRWEVLAAINEIESDYGRNLNVSSAGAVGWMQFMPSSWRQYGVDANRDGRKDPYNPVDAIFAAARYLDAAGYEDDPRGAIFAYNHADWYVDAVLLRARLIAGIPADLIGSLTGLTEARFPLRGHATYADDLAERQLLRRVGQSSDTRRSLDIFAPRGAALVAVNDGVIKSLERRRAGRIVLQDVYGNRFTYADVGTISGRLSVGTRVRGGRRLGRVGASRGGLAPHVRFSIRPSGRGAPIIDPKPILDGWKLLEATAIYRANGENVLREGPTVGQILLLSKPLLQQRVLADERIEIYECGRADISAGQIDRRVLAALAYLAESGLSPTVTSLRCGHSYHTKSGNVSEHSSGNAVDISRVNGIPVLGHQEPGSVADQAVRRLMLLQGTMVPHQVISLFEIGGPTLAMADHADHIHVGFRPVGEGWGRAGYSVLKPSQWPQLMSRLRALPNPVLPAGSQER